VALEHERGIRVLREERRRARKDKSTPLLDATLGRVG